MVVNHYLIYIHNYRWLINNSQLLHITNSYYLIHSVQSFSKVYCFICKFLEFSKIQKNYACQTHTFAEKYRIEFTCQIRMPKMFPLLFVFVQLTSTRERRCAENRKIHLLDCANLNVKNVPCTRDLGPWVKAIDFHNNVSAFNTTWLLM